MIFFSSSPSFHSSRPSVLEYKNILSPSRCFKRSKEVQASGGPCKGQVLLTFWDIQHTLKKTFFTRRSLLSSSFLFHSLSSLCFLLLLFGWANLENIGVCDHPWPSCFTLLHLCVFVATESKSIDSLLLLSYELVVDTICGSLTLVNQMQTLIDMTNSEALRLEHLPVRQTEWERERGVCLRKEKKQTNQNKDF